MNLNGTFILRDVAGEILAIPVGETALKLNGMVILNPVSKVIWKCLERDTNREEILREVTERFEVSETVAKEDIASFLSELKTRKFITED